MHLNSKLLFEKYAKPLFMPEMRVLELGPDAFPSTYQRLVNDQTLVWDTLDIYDNPRLTYSNSDEYSFDILDNSYDVVLSGQVIEHVRKPWLWIRELARVVKENGLVITIGPVSWHYHERPFDCWRIYPEGMKALYEEAGLTVLTSVLESLENPRFKGYLPGVSKEPRNPIKRAVYLFLRIVGFPFDSSYDTITIGRKRI